MDYYTKTIVLHQVEKGFSTPYKPFSTILRFEYDMGIYKCYLTFNNFLPKHTGELFLLICDSKRQCHFFPLEISSPDNSFTFSTIPYLDDSISCGIFYVENNIPLLIAFCKVNEGIDIVDMKKILYDKYSKNTVKFSFENIDKKNTDNKTNTFENDIDDETLKAYNDEAVATENYYSDDEDLRKQMDFIERFESDNNVDKEQIAEETTDKQSTDKNTDYSEQNPFYISIKNELESLFNKFPLENSINSAIPNSKFVKINYAENKYYIVGIIYENNVERYICYGVPDTNSKTPPKELKGYCKYIPISTFGFSNNGFWMMFQDAITGDCIKL